jgi:hypothetical protein
MSRIGDFAQLCRVFPKALHHTITWVCSNLPRSIAIARIAIDLTIASPKSHSRFQRTTQEV